MNRFLHLTLLSVTLLLHTNQAFAETVFVEQNGRLVVEVESAAAISNWQPTAAFTGYTGSAAYKWTGAGTTGARNADRGALTYHFKINTPGNYEFRWRSRIGEGTRGTEANDSWVRFPTGSNVNGEQPLSGWTKGFMNQVGEWAWRTVTVDHVGETIRQHFTAGVHTLEISGRSHGHVLDRFVLYKDDDVNFNDGVFTNAPQSPHTGDEIEVVTVTPEPEPVTNTEPTTNTDNMTDETPAVQLVHPWQISANQLIANECSDGVISLRPVSDITIDSNEIKNNDDLRIGSSGQSALLKFDLSSVPATANLAALTFNIGNDAGEGSIVLSAASHSNWNETDSSLLPDISHLIETINGTWRTADRYGLSFDYTLIGGESATLVIEMAQGANDITIVPSLGNDERSDEPRLNISGTGDFCADYAANLSNQDSTTETDVGSQMQKKTEGGGSLQLFELLLLILSLATVAGQHRGRE